ncbi:hypothetical protein ACGE24_08715 [Corynebacterium kroppenstedtii]|uniref:hypothetical protein n=1 Tax=Corynebacterium sp. PCR 32 TaxID=3351342 RepID=UPI00309E388D
MKNINVRYNDEIFAAVMFVACTLLVVVRGLGYIDEATTNRVFAGIVVVASLFQGGRWVRRRAHCAAEDRGARSVPPRQRL